MSITKIQLNAITSKLDVTKTDDVSKVAPSKLSKVEFSDNAKIFMDAVQAVKNAPDVRLDRIAEIKASLASGTYKVDSVKLADKMLRTHIADQ